MGEIVQAGNEIRVGVINGGREVEMSIIVVSIVEERTSEMGTYEVTIRGLPGDSNVDVPSPLLTFVSI